MNHFLNLLFLSAGVTVVPQNATYVLSWQDSSVPALNQFQPGTNSLYKLYSTSQVGLALTNWPLVATFTNWTLGTNLGQVWFTNSWSAPAQDTFFVVTASNLFGETPLALSPLVHSGPVGGAVSGLSLSVR